MDPTLMLKLYLSNHIFTSLITILAISYNFKLLTKQMGLYSTKISL